jgi:glycerol-3-phosphate dehydrogenase (NAD(P)+)
MSRLDAVAHPELGLRHAVVEGVEGASSVGELARKLGVEMPICAAVEAILHRGADVDATVTALLARPLREE